MNKNEIISILPYSKPFLFVDSIEQLNENSVTGYYTFKHDEYFYKGHFKNFAVTPGVILTETMAQIGLVCLGIFLLRNQLEENIFPQIAMTSTEVEFYLPVFPGEKVKVISEKIYFRFGKLKCNVKMLKNEDDMVCKGMISGMISAKGMHEY